MVSALGRAQSGIADAMLRLDVTAHNIANLATAGFEPSRVVSVESPGGGVTSIVTPAGVDIRPDASGTDLATEAAALILARTAFSANVAALRAAVDNERTLASLLA